MAIVDIHNILKKGPWPVELVEKSELPLHLEQDDHETAEKWDESTLSPTYENYYDDTNCQSIAKILPLLDIITAANEDIGNVGVTSDSPTEERKREIEAAMNHINSDPPDLTQYRTWTDCTGKWKTIALFVAYKDRHVRILKPSGETLDIPVQRMSHEDVEIVELALVD